MSIYYIGIVFSQDNIRLLLKLLIRENFIRNIAQELQYSLEGANVCKFSSFEGILLRINNFGIVFSPGNIKFQLKLLIRENFLQNIAQELQSSLEGEIFCNLSSFEGI